MRRNKLYILFLIGSVLGLAAFSAFAQESEESESAADVSAEDTAVAPATDDALMARMKDYSTPNENHKALEMLVGNWDAVIKTWMSPKSDPIVAQNKSESQMIFGGRFLQERFSGTFMGEPYEGMGIMGYDNIKKMFQYIWLDNSGTGIVKIDAQYDPATKSFFEQGNVSCPITGGQRWLRGKITILDADHYTQEFYMKDPADLVNGEEFKSMEITYSRVKK